MKTYWEGKRAVVTGAASGIGLALAAGLIERGVRVWAADIDDAGMKRAAASLGPHAYPVSLDVCDAPAFRELVRGVAEESGGIDFLFNNAGILQSGEVHDFNEEHFNRIIDINIRGVVNGTLAAYPLMVRQKHGHIINTASLAGLAPVPLMTSYAMSKHAVVGLSTSLRFEAERYGVRVSAICPSGVDTPLLDEAAADVTGGERWRPDVRRYLVKAAGPLCTVDRIARDALLGVERNQALIIIPVRARLTALAYRLVPGLVGAFGRQVIASELSTKERN
jgi:NAD(P)-dependent dehydrogenase (short-subunit alcohol dehydrogenase family)